MSQFISSESEVSKKRNYISSDEEEDLTINETSEVEVSDVSENEYDPNVIEVRKVKDKKVKKDVHEMMKTSSRANNSRKILVPKKRLTLPSIQTTFFTKAELQKKQNSKLETSRSTSTDSQQPSPSQSSTISVSLLDNSRGALETSKGLPPKRQSSLTKENLDANQHVDLVPVSLSAETTATISKS